MIGKQLGLVRHDDSSFSSSFQDFSTLCCCFFVAFVDHSLQIPFPSHLCGNRCRWKEVRNNIQWYAYTIVNTFSCYNAESVNDVLSIPVIFIYPRVILCSCSSSSFLITRELGVVFGLSTRRGILSMRSDRSRRSSRNSEKQKKELWTTMMRRASIWTEKWFVNKIMAESGLIRPHSLNSLTASGKMPPFSWPCRVDQAGSAAAAPTGGWMDAITQSDDLISLRILLIAFGTDWILVWLRLIC